MPSAAHHDKVEAEFTVDPRCRTVDLLSRRTTEHDTLVMLCACLREAEHLNTALSELVRRLWHKEEGSCLREHSLPRAAYNHAAFLQSVGPVLLFQRRADLERRAKQCQELGVSLGEAPP